MSPAQMTVYTTPGDVVMAEAITPFHRIFVPLPEGYDPDEDDGREALLRVGNCLVVLFRS